MYIGKGLGGAGAVAGGGGVLAATGFPVIGFSLIALVLIAVGFVLLRVAVVRRANR